MALIKQGKELIAVSIIFPVLAILFTILRFRARSKTSGIYKVDDYWLAAATVCCSSHLYLRSTDFHRLSLPLTVLHMSYMASVSTATESFVVIKNT